MNIKAIMPLLAVAMMGGLSGCATTTNSYTDVKTDDSGYFLSLKQKRQLIGTGRIQDAHGNLYDVWIVPGYVQPAQHTKTYLKRTGRKFAEYVQSRKYRDLANASGDAFKWAYKDCFTDFTVKGVPRAWNRYWSTAQRRTNQRVFGWWFAYPWALMESTVNTVFRVPVGLTGTVLGTVWGGAVVPGYYAVNSATAGTWHFAVDTVFLPSVACTWNTVIAPPLAMAGQKPAPSRADGFWLKQISVEDLQAASAVETPISPKDIEALAVWGSLLLTASQPYDDRRQALREQTQAERDAIMLKLQKGETDIASEEEAAIKSIVPDPAEQETIDYLRSRGFGSMCTPQIRRDVRRYLSARTELSRAEINRIMELLTRYPPSTINKQAPPRPKTDPVQRSLDMIEEMQ